MGIENFITFLIATLVFVITPGIDTIFVLNKSIGLGKKSGFYGALGVNTGVLVHTLLAALGLSVLLAKSAVAFAVVKYLGAFYLIYLGFFKLKKKEGIALIHEYIGPTTTKKDFLSGFVTNLLNPKVALFFLAFFPQFVQKDQIENPVPFLLLGFTYAIFGIVWAMILIFFATFFSDKFKKNPKINTRLGKLTGLVFVTMGIKIALTKS
ncbi:threonine/homoserine/homoserine lactone efflux protein [Wenyingzhuangia heitensis]|uniref:Threonine/homoserine/homoserine lactone efflux protein n=1 Tax=Wenyingzhuangia heitensis TaxID=1487859 RepID=A0ABX0U4I1_9FLAO|nr:LysE family translocator [Wenyingzhuangia heitensis]NIJ43688.1 threonine/homoserine/homoserine lactone efflux protein [Wenyingzhuangia heitensis]